MQFLFPSLAFGFFLVMAPLLIHLINMMRHKRVKWAAMEFLLASYKKQKKWIWLKQLLLLLLRMAAIAAVVAMLAQVITKGKFSALSGKATHHYIVIDDSFSMADRVGGVEAFDQAWKSVSRIAQRAAGEESRQKLTLIRFSQAARAGGEGSSGVADLNAAPVGNDIAEVLGEISGKIRTTQLDSGPGPALSFVKQLLTGAPDETALVYVVCDFRQKDWSEPEGLRKLLESIEAEGASVHFVRCASEQHANLAITKLEPAPGVPAAGVPMFAFVSVANYGEKPVKDVPVSLRTVTYSQTQVPDPKQVEGVVSELSTVLIKEIQPGQQITERFQVAFPTQGYHVIEAELPADAVDVDNRRWSVIDFTDGLPVLLVDGSQDGANAYFLSRSLAPSLGDGESVESSRARGYTGIIPEIRPVAFLRDAPPGALSRYHAIYLLDVGRLDDRAVRNLEDYVEGGGGLAFFLGQDVDSLFYEQLYGDGLGMFPILVDRPAILQHEAGEREPDFTVENHPILDSFWGERNSNLNRIFIYYYWQTASDWEPPTDSSIRVLARLRGSRSPLIVEKQYGAGRVVALLTSLSPDWNNWTEDPSFVATMLSMQQYLSAGRQAAFGQLVGTPIEVDLAVDQFDPNVLFTVPTDLAEQRRDIEVQAEVPEDDAAVMVASIGKGVDLQGLLETDHSGVYSIWLYSINGQYEVRRLALNVDPAEGNLVLLDKGELSEQFNTIDLELHDAGDLEYELADGGGYNWSQIALLVLLGLLIGEQALAYSASYHPARGGAA